MTGDLQYSRLLVCPIFPLIQLGLHCFPALLSQSHLHLSELAQRRALMSKDHSKLTDQWMESKGISKEAQALE